MKRKLLCIFFIIIGAACFVGTILLSGIRDEYADGSPFLTLIILSVVTIVMAVRRFNYEPDEPKVEISGRERVVLWVFRAVCILAILACLAFIVIMLFVTGYYAGWMRNVGLLMILAVIGVAAAALGLSERPPIIGRDIAKAVVALVITASLLFFYVSYMPRYTQDDGLNILRSEQELAQMDIFYPEAHIGWQPTGTYPRYDERSESLFGGNPFYTELFQYYYNSYGYDGDGLYYMYGCIEFDPARGAYKLQYEKGKTYIPGEWPKFRWNFMCDENGRHDAVVNLYFREWNPFANTLAAKRNPMCSVSSGEWDAKMSDIVYLGGFPEDEARAFLKSIEEEALKSKLLEQIEVMLPAVVLDRKEDSALGLTVIDTKDNPIEVFFFGIDIAAYQNGEIILKL